MRSLMNTYPLTCNTLQNNKGHNWHKMAGKKKNNKKNNIHSNMRKKQAL